MSTITEQHLLSLYWGNGLTQEEVADECAASQPTIQRHFEEYDIPTRRPAAQKRYWPFGGSVDDAVRLLDRRDDLFIRLYVGGQCHAYWFYKYDGAYWLNRNKTTTRRIDPDSDLLQSYFESYEPEICYRDAFESINP